jgi:REP element-mobilizing transposase RayT
MSVRREIANYEGLYFITFTCCRWIKLFEITNGYEVIYKWFDHLKSKGHYINGYVIMPNHVHALIAFSNSENKSINSIVGVGKRFMAYRIVKRLKEQGNEECLIVLSSYVNTTDGERGKLHEVFEPSFDWKECRSKEFTAQKLDYIHDNPCRGEWNLAKSPIDYQHSSARYYLTGTQGIYPVTNYSELKDVDLTQTFESITRSAESRGGDSAEK